VLFALSLVASLSMGGWPKDASASPVENASWGPMEVCDAMTGAVKAGDMDTLVGHTTAYARARFSEKTKFALKGLHSLLIGVRCVRLDMDDEKSDPPRAQVWVYAPEGKSRDLPFVKENGFWRYDQETYEKQHGKKAQ
jgi:hypothetical protein